MKPVSRKELIRRLRALGFEGPFSGRKHPIMVKGSHRIHVPNEHGEDIGVRLLMKILRQAGVGEEEWDSAGG